MLIAVLIAALVGLFLFDTVRLRRMQVQRDAAKEEGREEERLTNARRMKAEGLNSELINRITGLSEEEIAAL